MRNINNNLQEAKRWFKQAENDLSASKNSLNSENYEWACFQAQQSAEKALKSILYAKGYRKILTHSIYELVKEVSKFDKAFTELKKKAKILDAVYIPARYPNGIAGEMIPAEYYEQEDAKECISYAGLILEKAKEIIK